MYLDSTLLSESILDECVELITKHAETMESKGFKKIRINRDWDSDFAVMTYNNRIRVDAFVKVKQCLDLSKPNCFIAKYIVKIKESSYYKEASRAKTIEELFNTIDSLNCPEKLKFSEKWHTPSEQEIVISDQWGDELSVKLMSSIANAKTVGMVHISEHGRVIFDGLWNPNVKPYFHTIALDHNNRQIHFLTDCNKSRFMVAEKFGNSIIVCSSSKLFFNQFDIAARITKTDMKIVNLAVELWMKKVMFQKPEPSEPHCDEVS